MKFFIFMGILFFVIGLVGYFFPNLIAGYNMLSAKQREQIDIVRFKRVLLIGMSLLATCAIGFSFLPDSPLTHIVWVVFSLFVIGLIIFWGNRKK
ncbi:DUF3784 domain-containing protein [Porphyromonas circumdentaria]|nr:DUF3784 domain-containing protein [Porphyromonas circumdentaria]MBB6275963.1 uncharacterized membrane protein YbaN (DUF454 family) [Porphyromonas circumdentaria]MDO4721974.1 DUF3784 domain-containing protein [Porphyromonas circumdentaria]